MIKVIVNGEWYATFATQEEVDRWIQGCDHEFFWENSVEYRYNKEEQ